MKETLCISERRREQPPAKEKHVQVGIFLINRFVFCVSAGFPAFSGVLSWEKRRGFHSNKQRRYSTFCPSNAECGSSMCDSFFLYISLIYNMNHTSFYKKKDPLPTVFFNFFSFSTEVPFDTWRLMRWPPSGLQKPGHLELWIRDTNPDRVWLSKTSLLKGYCLNLESNSNQAEFVYLCLLT